MSQEGRLRRGKEGVTMAIRGYAAMYLDFLEGKYSKGFAEALALRIVEQIETEVEREGERIRGTAHNQD